MPEIQILHKGILYGIEMGRPDVGELYLCRMTLKVREALYERTEHDPLQPVLIPCVEQPLPQKQHFQSLIDKARGE